MNISSSLAKTVRQRIAQATQTTAARRVAYRPRVETLEERLVPTLHLPSDPSLFVPVSTSGPLAVHIEARVEIFLDGHQINIPANVGDLGDDVYPLHTHHEDLVDVDSPVPRSFHLEDFFAVWNKTKHGHEVLAELDATDALTVTVNGTTTIDINLVTLHDHDTIIIEAITPTPPPAPVTPSNQALVTRLYQDLLHRPPDTAGLVGFITALDEGQSHLQVAQSIMASHEYQAVEVQGLYHTLLHRNADAGGLAGFTSLLASGATVAQVEDILLASPEYFQVAGGTNAGFVEALYSDLLHRQADAAGAAVWQADLSNGQTRDQVAAGFLKTQEAETVELQALYQECLHRPADVSGLAGFLAFLHNGGTQEQVVAQMVGSVEYGHAA